MSADRIALSFPPGSEHRKMLKEVAGRISRGEVFVYPTETIYGIGGRFDDPEVYRKIIAAKVRPHEQAMILVAGRRDALDRLDLTFPPAARELASAWWPGPLTMVLPSKEHPEGVAVRVSDHPLLAALATHVNVPLYSTSANVSGSPYVPDPDAIYTLMKDRVDFMIDAGTLPDSKPSTVVRVTGDNAVSVLREGSIATAMVHRSYTR